jgi:hypothetical protein
VVEAAALEWRPPRRGGGGRLTGVGEVAARRLGPQSGGLQMARSMAPMGGPTVPATGFVRPIGGAAAMVGRREGGGGGGRRGRLRRVEVEKEEGGD